MTVYAFGLEEHSYFNSGGHKSDLYYYTLGGRLLGALDNSGKTTFYLTDALGSVLSSFSNVATSAAIKGNQVFGPYGNARDSQGTINTAKGYTGQYNDSLTGLDYYGSRYYDQVAGVFLSADTVQGNGSGENPYGYVGGNPETKNDPTGQRFVQPGGGGGGGTPPPPTNWPKPTTDPNTLLQMCSQNPACAAAFRDYHNRLAQTYLSTEFGIFVGVAGVVAGVLADNPEFMQQEEEDVQKLTEVGVEEGAFAKALGCSFTPQTLVRTEHALQPIGNVHPGDKVLAYNPKTHKMEWQPILHLWIHTDNDLIDLTITTTTPTQHDKPATKTSEVIHTTQKHPFFTFERGFLPVGQITLGMHVLRADGRVGVITGWKIVPGVKTMYNLEVAQDHTFTVGDGQWVVHNTCNPTDEELLKAFETASNKDAELEAEAGLLARMYSKVLNFKEVFKDEATGKILGENDVETPGAIIEATNAEDGKWGQISKRLMGPVQNPSGKPIILYAPNYLPGATKFLEDRGVYVAKNPDELIIWITLLQGG